MLAGSEQVQVQLYASRSVAAIAAAPCLYIKEPCWFRNQSFTQLQNAVHWSLSPMFRSELTFE